MQKRAEDKIIEMLDHPAFSNITITSVEDNVRICNVKARCETTDKRLFLKKGTIVNFSALIITEQSEYGHDEMGCMNEKLYFAPKQYVLWLLK